MQPYLWLLPSRRQLDPHATVSPSARVLSGAIEHMPVASHSQNEALVVGVLVLLEEHLHLCHQLLRVWAAHAGGDGDACCSSLLQLCSQQHSSGGAASEKMHSMQQLAALLPACALLFCTSARLVHCCCCRTPVCLTICICNKAAKDGHCWQTWPVQLCCCCW